MADVEIIAYHGWGFDASCWKHWLTLMPVEYTFSAFDRGYFGEAVNPDFSKRSSLKVIFAHSFGLHLSEARQFEQADLLVIFNGFLSFHPHAAQFRRRSRLVLNEMVKQLKVKPHDVLTNFYEKVFHPEEPWDLPGTELEMQKLSSDLIRLDAVELSVQKLKKTGKICILHGSKDGIVPKGKGRELFEVCQDRARYFEVKDAGHALPMTHLQRCWSFIEPEIRRMIAVHG